MLTRRGGFRDGTGPARTVSTMLSCPQCGTRGVRVGEKCPGCGTTVATDVATNPSTYRPSWLADDEESQSRPARSRRKESRRDRMQANPGNVWAGNVGAVNVDAGQGSDQVIFLEDEAFVDGRFVPTERSGTRFSARSVPAPNAAPDPVTPSQPSPPMSTPATVTPTQPVEIDAFKELFIAADSEPQISTAIGPSTGSAPTSPLAPAAQPQPNTSTPSQTA